MKDLLKEIERIIDLLYTHFDDYTPMPVNEIKAIHDDLTDVYNDLELMSLHQKEQEGMSAEWINIKDGKPEYKKDVIVCRPNRYSGKNDILIARLYPSKKEGTEYGSGNGFMSYLKTYNDYWALPAIVLFESITHWMPLPKPPKTK